MSTIAAALFPIFSLIVLGYLLRLYQFPGDALWPLAARLTYFVLFPALLTRTFALADFSGLAVLPIIGGVTASMLLVATLLYLGKPLWGVDGPAFTSIFQGGIRHNTYVGLASAAALYGDSGVTLAAILLMSVTPLVNILSVTVLTLYGKNANPNWQRVIISILQNPLILACFVGFLLNLIGLGLPFGTDEILSLLGRTALPLGLLIVGAGLDLASLRRAAGAVSIAIGFKLLLYPTLTTLFCLLLNLTGETRTIMLLFSALPTAAASYMLALELGGDERLMATILTGQILTAMLTLPLILTWLGG